MTNEQLNKFIALEVMELPCWHQWQECEEAELVSEYGQMVVCMECDLIEKLVIHNPDYTSESSPRELLNQSRDKAIAEKGAFEYGSALTDIVLEGEADACDIPDEIVACRLNSTPAETIALTCAKLYGWKEGGV